MRTANEILHKWGYKKEYSGVDKLHVIEAMKEFAKEVLRDFDNWKAHKTPDLVEHYIKEKGL